MIDDTCYSIPCQSSEEADFLYELLTSDPAIQFLQSLVFVDSKRPITIDVLRRLSLVELARELGRLDKLQQFVYAYSGNEEQETQIMLLMEPKKRYLGNHST